MPTDADLAIGALLLLGFIVLSGVFWLVMWLVVFIREKVFHKDPWVM